MARNQNNDLSLAPVRRVLLGVIVLFLIGLFLLWRIDGPRVERLRTAVVDTIAPTFFWMGKPITFASRMLEDFQSYTRIYQQNQDLRRELQDMKAWREAAVQLEQENARLLALNSVQLNPSLTKVTGVVMADNGSPFRQSVLLNVGARDGIIDGWATMDGLGLVGRISGVGSQTSRVILVTDPGSRIPVTIEPSGQRAILSGDNLFAPRLDFLETPELIRPGDRVVTSGDGGVFPSELLVGRVTLDNSGLLRTRLSADLGRLEYLRVLRAPQAPEVEEHGDLVGEKSDLPDQPSEDIEDGT